MHIPLCCYLRPERWRLLPVPTTDECVTNVGRPRANWAPAAGRGPQARRPEPVTRVTSAYTRSPPSKESQPHDVEMWFCIGTRLPPPEAAMLTVLPRNAPRLRL